MKRYEYVNVNISKPLGSKSEEHRAIIDEYATKGYRYVGYIPTSITNAGKLYEGDFATISENHVFIFSNKSIISFHS